MKIFIISLMIIALVVLGYYIYKTCKEKHKLTHTVRGLLSAGFVIIFFHTLSLFTTSEVICLFGYSGYFAAANWLLYYLLRFSIEYIGNEFENHVKKKYMILLLCLDNVSIFLNNVFQHLFTLEPVTLFKGEEFFALQITPLFYTHYAIILMLVTFCLVSLFYRSVKSPMFYRKRYLAIAIGVVIIVIINAFSMNSAIDISVFSYAIEGVCIYYCVFVYTPQKLLPKTLFQVAQNMSVGLFVLDVEGKKLYSNKCGENFLSKESPLVNKDGTTLEEWCRVLYMQYDKDFKKEQSFFRGEEELILKIELQRMVDAKSQLQGGYFVIQDRTEEINNMKLEQYLATHDSLTGLYNKGCFDVKAARYIKRHAHEKLLMICTDIKDFKMINDFLGTQTGDTVLVNFARIIKEQAGENSVYGRLGNDVFAILMHKEDYKETLFSGDEHDFFAGAEKNVSIPLVNYMGVYEITQKDVSVAVMCDRARMAIATIKGDYHKRVAYYNNTIRDNIMHEQELIHGLTDAIQQEQLKMYLQPQFSADGKILGAEALVRWIHPEKGAILPGDFIPVFEKNGLISDVDQFIWEKACKQLRQWKEEGKEDLYISVNISPRDFYFLNIYQIFVDLVEKYQINPSKLKLEITETAIVMDFNRQLELIKKLRHNGFVVEMDDFGSGYSSLNMLKDIHVDILKIDMGFLKKANDEERSKKILQMIISLSKHLDMPVITEGVETAEQVQFLAEMGCEMFQGYYFAKPMSVQEFEEFYAES